VLTFTISGISVGGHLGGVVVGGICGWVMLAPSWRPVPQWAVRATPVLLGAGSVLISVALTA
jgi:membrane associated rhomboid family serine protease